MTPDRRYIDLASRTLNPFARDLAAKPGDRGLAIAYVRDFDEEKREVTAVLSTGRIDRYGKIVLPSAYENTIENFMLNPKFIAGHKYSTPNGKPTSIGHWTNLKITDEGLIGTAKFLPPGDELADSWWFRFVNKAQRTFSVGFIAISSMLKEVAVNNTRKVVRHFTEVELLEVSAVEIPANADALLRTAGAFGFGDMAVADDTEGHEIKERGEPSKLSNRQLSIIARQLGEPLRKMLREELSQLVTDVVRTTLDAQTSRRGISHDALDYEYDETGRFLGLSGGEDGGDVDEDEDEKSAGDGELADALREILAGSDGSR